MNHTLHTLKMLNLYSQVPSCSFHYTEVNRHIHPFTAHQFITTDTKNVNNFLQSFKEITVYLHLNIAENFNIIRFHFPNKHSVIHQVSTAKLRSLQIAF